MSKIICLELLWRGIDFVLNLLMLRTTGTLDDKIMIEIVRSGNTDFIYKVSSCNDQLLAVTVLITVAWYCNVIIAVLTCSTSCVLCSLSLFLSLCFSLSLSLGWKTRPQPKTVILLIKKSIKSVNLSFAPSLPLCLSVCLSLFLLLSLPLCLCLHLSCLSCRNITLLDAF